MQCKLLLFVNSVRQYEQAVAHVDIFANNALGNARKVNRSKIPEVLYAKSHEIFGNVFAVLIYSASLFTFRTSTPSGTF